MNSVIGLERIRAGKCDLVSFGRMFVSNPDLAERILENKQLNTNIDWTALFTGPKGENLGAKGYTDYPFYNEWKLSTAK